MEILNKFTIEEVRFFWDNIAEEYNRINKKIGPAHSQRFTESMKYLNLKDGDKVLNIWSRTGNAYSYINKSANNLTIHNLEVSQKMIDISKKNYPNAKFSQTNLESLKFEDNYFDSILSLETLEHTPRPFKLLKEFYRVLKKNGNLVMSLPPKTAEIPLSVYEFFFENHGEGPHNFLPSKKVKSMLNEVGFSLLKHRGTLLFPVGPEWMQELGEKIIKVMQNTPIKELGIRQFYICKK